MFKPICTQFKVQKFPQLLIMNHNKETPVPVEYFGEYDSDKLYTFIKELIKEPFIHSYDTQSSIDFMMKKCQKGVFFFFFVTSDEVPEYLYKLSKKNFGNATILVQSGFDNKAYEDFNIVTFQDKISPGEDNVFAVINELDLQDTNILEQWIQELYKFSEQQHDEISQQQNEDDFDDDY